jgi:hypothetical protein
LNLENPAVQRVLLYALDMSKGDLEVARAHIEAWFDSSMARVSGWYKRSTQWIVLVIALVVTVALNIDTIRIAQFLYHDDAARSAIVARAEAAAKDPDRNYQEAKAELAALQLPIGWDNAEAAAPPVSLTRILGWLLTALAATLGAPFWFDVLNKFVTLRSTVKPPAKSRDDSAKDTQQRPAPAPAPAGPAIAPPALAAAGAGAGNGRSAGSSGLALASTVRDKDSGVDACDIDMAADETTDDQLPVAAGGVG